MTYSLVCKIRSQMTINIPKYKMKNDIMCHNGFIHIRDVRKKYEEDYCMEKNVYGVLSVIPFTMQTYQKVKLNMPSTHTVKKLVDHRQMYTVRLIQWLCQPPHLPYRLNIASPYHTTYVIVSNLCDGMWKTAGIVT